MEDLLLYPGGELVSKGLRDLNANEFTEEALLVLSARFRLEPLGFDVKVPESRPDSSELALYELVLGRLGVGAHAAYNALRRRMDSFVNSYGQHLRRTRAKETTFVS